jgi:histone acetyltransferase SAS3
MADAQLMEEQLQQSVMMAEGVSEFQDDGADADIAMDNSNRAAFATNDEVGIGLEDAEIDVEMDHDDDAQGDDDDGALMAEDDEEEEGDEDDEDDESDDDDDEGEGDEDDDAFEDDAEGEEEEYDIPHEAVGGQRRHEGTQPQEEDEDEDEGVGAVKIKPGETDDEDESDDGGSLNSHSEVESEDDGAWEEVHDPGEDFEQFMTCSACGENGRFAAPSILLHELTKRSPPAVCTR